MLWAARTGLLRETARRSGDQVVVQVKSVRSGGKADIVSEDITLTGRYVVYLPNSAKIASSRSISKDRVAVLKAALLAAGITGAIIRSAAANAPAEDVLAEAQELRASWQLTCRQEAMLGTLLSGGPAAATRLATDYSRHKLSLRQGGLDDRSLRESIATLHSPEFMLPAGGSIMIEPTAALVAIDVNAGLRPAAAVNNEAASLIACQLRLRNLSGLILIDFAGGQGQASLKALEDAVAADPAGCRIGGVTPAGLVELTRPRRDLPLVEKLAQARYTS